MIVTLVTALVLTASTSAAENPLMELARCHLCESKAVAGPIEGCCQECDAGTVEKANAAHYLPILDEITRTASFRYFQVDLWRECALWPDDAMCMRESCAVCECPPDQLPPALQATSTASHAASDGAGCGNSDEHLKQRSAATQAAQTSGWAEQAAQLSRVQLGGGPDEQQGLQEWRLPEGDEEQRQWTVADAQSDSLAYVDLLANPEGFTGYSGPSAHRIWSSIYDENCFGNPEAANGSETAFCLEERAFYRLVSGLHASISTHLSRDAMQGKPHHQLWVDRVGRWPNRLRNLYFAFLVVLRAVHKAAPSLLDHAPIASGNADEDHLSSSLLRALLDNERAPVEAQRVAGAFDETAMFQVRREDVLNACPAVLSGGLDDMRELTKRFKQEAVKKEQLRQAFRGKFRNISRIMDCVGCEKCRMWGKLQFLGLGTAMKVLFDEEGTVHLTRNEAVALINVLHRLSISVAEVGAMRNREAAEALTNVGLITAAGAALAALASALACVCWRRQEQGAMARAMREGSKID